MLLNLKIGIVACFLAFPLFSRGEELDVKMRFSVEKRDYSYYDVCIAKYTTGIVDGGSVIKTEQGEWNISVKESPIEKGKKYEVTFLLQSGFEQAANVSVEFPMANWNKNNYVLFPGAVYNGNRFQSRRIAYSPKLLDPKDIGVDKPMVISDVPRLNVGDGPSEIQERSGAMSVPSIGFWDFQQKRSFILLTMQANECGDLGIGIKENRQRNEAVISLRSPLIREGYRFGTNVSVDKPKDFKAGDSVRFVFKVLVDDGERLQDLFASYLDLRDDELLQKQQHAVYPYSYCYKVMENKFNTQNYVADWGYYAVGLRSNYFQDWQIGWTGGMITTYPLLFNGKKETVENVIRNFDWLFQGGIAPSGLFWDAGEKGNIWYGGDIRKPHTKNWHLIRKSGDALFFILKQFDVFKKKNLPVQSNWEEGTRGVADAFVKMWRTYGQFGQFVDNPTGKIEVGGSTSGANLYGSCERVG